MDSTVETAIDLGQSGESKDSRVVEMGTINEVGEMLGKSIPGVMVIDHDFTLKPKKYELGMGGKEPGRLPDESIELLKSLKNTGWEILVVTNQPGEGHQVARFVKEFEGLFKRGNYPIFPGSLEDVIGKEGIHGAGRDFLWKKYKSTPEAVKKTVTWVEEKLGSVLGQIYFVGDRESDVAFAEKVKDELRTRGESRALNIWKVRGLELPGIFKHLEKFIP
ncbi:hypothetical protein D4S03_05085 [bacterium]|nr:MAG: hypothetical protein D4S03_05085 [bacterium]